MGRLRKDLFLFCLLAILAVFVGSKPSAEGQAPQADEKIPITISSERLEGDFKAGIISFHGQVKVVRGELILHADQVDVYPKKKGQDVERIVATGNVRVIHGTRSSVSERVEFVEETGLLVLTGAARVSDGKNTITGPLIRLYLDEDRAEVEGNSLERPTFLFHPETMKDQDIKGD